MAEPLPSIGPDLMAANTTWNPSDCNPQIALSNGNLTATTGTSGSGIAAVRAADSQTSGKFYFECTMNVVNSTSTGIGVGLASASLSAGGVITAGVVAVIASGTVVLSGSGLIAANSFTAGQTVCIAVDFTGNLIWFRVGAAGNWNASAGNNPATGVGGANFSSIATGPLFPFFGTEGQHDACTANFGGSAFVGTVPSGFTSGFPGAAASVPAGAPFIPHGPVPYLAYPATMDYPRLVYSAPRFEVVAIADIIEPSVQEAVQGMLPTLVPPYVTAAANAAVQNLAVQLVGSTMTGPLMLSPAIPTAPSMAASMQYVQSMVATVVPEVPPVPAGQAWARQTGQWIPLAGGGTVTNIATGAGLTGGPITSTGTIAMASMAANSIKGNNTGAVAAPTDIPAGTVLTMIGAAPLNSPVFTGSPSLPTGTAAITQPGGTNNTSVATTAFVATSLGSYAPIASPVFTGAPSLPTGTIAVTQAPGTSNTTVATTAFTAAAITAGTANYLPLTGGRLSGGLASGPAATVVPGLGSLTLNANAVAPPATAFGGIQEWVVGANNTNTTVMLDAFGTTTTNAIPVLQFRRARGTAAGPTTTQNGDYLGAVEAQGYAVGAYGVGGATQLNFLASENWTGTAQGSSITLASTPLGTTAPVVSLALQGNTATFSGTVGCTLATLRPASGQDVLFTLDGTATASGHQWYVLTKTASSVGDFWIYDVTQSAQRLVISAAGACSASSAWGVISDASLKSEIEDHPHGLAEILKLQPRRFRMIDDDRIATGLIAQELETVMPELVGEMATADGGTVKTVTEAGVIWPMINAIKTLEQRLSVLEGRA